MSCLPVKQNIVSNACVNDVACNVATWCLGVVGLGDLCTIVNSNIETTQADHT